MILEYEFHLCREREKIKWGFMLPAESQQSSVFQKIRCKKD